MNNDTLIKTNVIEYTTQQIFFQTDLFIFLFLSYIVSTQRAMETPGNLTTTSRRLERK